MSKDLSNKEFLFDNRIIQRNIRQGRVERDEFEQYLASLPDLKEMCDDIGEEIYGREHRSAAVCGEYSRSEEDDDA